MSAFLCSDEHLLVLVHAAMSDGDVSWYHDRNHHSLRRLDFDAANRVLQMLRTENCKSLRARYEDCEEMWPEMAHPLFYDAELAFERDPTPVEVLKAIQCYEYQTCEHEEWEASEAKAFCGALRLAMIRDLPGYDDAPWGWDQETFRKRRGNVRSLTGMLVKRGIR